MSVEAPENSAIIHLLFQRSSDFSTMTNNVNFLCSLESIYVDGTFEYCAKHFYQLFSIHGYKNFVYFTTNKKILILKH
ncbi:Uncharacterized protein FWK35_00015867 [Aphis craccivora]|uniref:Uncharacterized protein n=1 Tax=Aphis craccivora TaxID=307492 RepID=A0A6G0YXL4_APHCR|nr:Uncharacterized protein FWK35_00015867 [Aphis craccivora]